MILSADDEAKLFLAEAIYSGESCEWDEACDSAEFFFARHGRDACYCEAERYSDM